MSRKKKVCVVVVVAILGGASAAYAGDITTQGWIDGPFFDLLGRFGDLYSSYTATAYGIGRILLMVDLGLMAVLWALNGGGVQKELNRPVLTGLAVTAMMIL